MQRGKSVPVEPPDLIRTVIKAIHHHFRVRSEEEMNTHRNEWYGGAGMLETVIKGRKNREIRSN